MKIERRLSPGVFDVKWALSGREGNTYYAPGRVELHAYAQPHGVVRDGQFTEWLVDYSDGLLSEFQLETVSGSLPDGTRVNLIGVEGDSYPGFAQMRATAALVGDVALRPADVSIDALLLQMAGLFDVYANVSATPASLGTSAGVTAALIIESRERGGVERESRAVSLSYDQPVSLEDALRTYVEPLRRILSVASGRPQPITAFSLGLTPSNYTDPPTWFDVFGSAVGHEVDWRIPGLPPLRQPALTLGTGAPSLLDMLDRWAQLEASDHPLTDLYGASIYTERSPRSRFLSAVQTLEGTWGFDNRTSLQAEQEKYERQRDDARLAVNRLGKADASFIRDFLPAKKPANLTESIRSACAPFIESMEEELRGDSGFRAFMESEDTADPIDAVREIRNGLSHGRRSFSSAVLTPAAAVMESAVRRLLLGRLGVT